MPDSSQAASPGPRPDDTQLRVLLAMLHNARSRGDRRVAEYAWEQILIAEMQRVRGIARGFRNSALPNGRIPAAEIDDVAQNVFMRLHAKVDQLNGKSPGELRAFLRTATGFTCQDYLDAHIRDDKRRHGSLDASDGDPPSATDRALHELATQLAAEDDDAQIARAVIHQALALVDEDKRAVLLMDLAGFDIDEIMERFGISRDNVYQRRRRGLKQLGDAIREQAGEDEAQ